MGLVWFSVSPTQSPSDDQAKGPLHSVRPCGSQDPPQLSCGWGGSSHRRGILCIKQLLQEEPDLPRA